MQLRPYQADLVERVYASLERNTKVMMQLPTGGGKTCIFVKMICDWVEQGKRVLILVHRQELINQSLKKLLENGLNVGVIKSGHISDYNLPVQLASVQTMIRREEHPEIDMVVIDEAHHVQSSNTYGKILQLYPQAKVLGVSATPCRLDGSGFADVFQDLVLGPAVSDLIRDGFLSPFEVYSSPVDLSNIREYAGDYAVNDLRQSFNNAVIVTNLVENWKLYASNMQTVVFAIDIEHSKAIVRSFQEVGIAAEHLDANTSDVQRESILRRFADRKIQILSNVNIISEGFDCPGIECVQLVRPTKSLSLYLQQVGRALRVSPDKEKSIILDFAGCIERHGMPDDYFMWSLEEKAKRGSQMIPHPNLPSMIEHRARERQSYDRRYITIESILEQVEDKERKSVKSIYDMSKYFDNLSERLSYTERKNKTILYYLNKHNQYPSEEEWQMIGDTLGESEDWWRHQRAGYYHKKDRKQKGKLDVFK